MLISSTSQHSGPIKQIVSPLVKTFVVANKDLIEATANDEASCGERYPVHCEGSVSFDNCQDAAGVIGCNEKTGRCPIFFQVGASKNDDMVSGWVCLIIAMFILIMCLVGLVAVLRKVLLGASTRIIYKATNINDILAMCIGCGVTILVQSSSITTSALVPLAGVGVLKLEKMYPLELGADIGTTFTALMAAMVSSKVESLQIALVHLFFNLTGIVIWYRKYIQISCSLSVIFEVAYSRALSLF
jgi:sodium-dependent phosphate cotransporter